MLNTKKHILISICLLILIIAISQTTYIDNYIQNFFYDATLNTWLVNRDDEVLKFIFYDGIKRVLIVLVLFLVLSLIIFRDSRKFQSYKKGIMIVILSAIFIPTITNLTKKATNMPCPKNIEIFGGTHPDIKLFEFYPDSFQKQDKVHCWPAGHASGGFALLSLFFLFRTFRNKIIGVGIALSIGWSMGIYKMLIGDHFFSHTLITMVLAWIVVLVISLFFKIKEE